MHSRRLLVLTGLVGLTFATVAGINSVSADSSSAEAETSLDGPKDPALENLVRRNLVAQSGPTVVDRMVSER